MKKIAWLFFALLCIYVVYFDLTEGTLPGPQNNQPANAAVETAAIPSPIVNKPVFQVKVTPGDTVLTIIEHQLKRPVPVSIDEIISDFSALNHGLSPQKIQIGKVYLFPDYTRKK